MFEDISVSWLCCLLGYNTDIADKALRNGNHNGSVLDNNYIANVAAILLVNAVKDYKNNPEVVRSVKSITRDRIDGSLNFEKTLYNNGFKLREYCCDFEEVEDSIEIDAMINGVIIYLLQFSIERSIREQLIVIKNTLKTNESKTVTTGQLIMLEHSREWETQTITLLHKLQSIIFMSEHGDKRGLSIGLLEYIEQGRLFEKFTRSQFLDAANEKMGWTCSSSNRQIKYCSTRDCNNTPRMMSDIYCKADDGSMEIIGECKFSCLKNKSNREYTNQLKSYVMEQRDNKESNKVFGVLIYPNLGRTECVTENDSDMCITQMYIDMTTDDVDDSIARFREGINYIMDRGTTWQSGIDDIELRRITLGE